MTGASRVDPAIRERRGIYPNDWAPQNDWAPVHQGIAGPVIFAMRRMSGTHQLYVEIWKARGLCAPGLVDMLILSEAQIMASSC